MDFIQRLDPSKLIFVETLLSFGLSLFSSPPYNFPLFLFGTYIQDNSDAVLSLQMFTTLLGASILFDAIWILNHDQSGIIRFITAILMLLKMPTFIVFIAVARDRQAHTNGFGRLDSTGATVWSMPGGFTSSEREGYQPVDEERAHGNNPVKPTSTPIVHTTAQPPPGAYQV
ncbi:hypothetical protein APHAL10511_006373 [Amanita phalloides]|nr:hypothetical protein APHAL10511_006373 [Amanita phalloides]